MAELNNNESKAKSLGDLLLKWLPLIAIILIPVLAIFSGGIDAYVDGRADVVSTSNHNQSTLDVTELKNDIKILKDAVNDLEATFGVLGANQQGAMRTLASLDETQRQMLQIMLQQSRNGGNSSGAGN